MSVYVTARELLQFSVPGLPGTERSIKRWAMRKRWPFRARKGLGGGVEYPILGCTEADLVLSREQQEHVRAVISSLDDESADCPADFEAIKAIISAKRTATKQESKRQEGSVRQASLMPENSKIRMNARLQIISAWHEHWTANLSQTSLTDSEQLFVFAYNQGKIDTETWIREMVPAISLSTLRRWKKQLKCEGIAALGGKYGNRKGCGLFDTQVEVRDFVIGMMAANPHVRGVHIREGLRARFGKRKDIKLPALRSLERWMDTWKRENAQTFTALTNPDAWKNKHMVAFGSASESIERLNQRWELDSTPADLMLSDGKRYTIIGAIDVYTRRMKLLVSPTSKATAVSTLLRHALLDWGVPELLKTDNGSDYKSKHMQTVVIGLGIEQEFCQPHHPWQKPHIERAFRTFSHSFLELLPGYLGHNVAERKAIEAQKSFADRLMKKDVTVELAMSPEELQTFCDKWCSDYYHHEPHDGLNGKTPWQVASGWPHPVRRIEDPRVLDVLLAEAPNGNGRRTVNKSGIRIEGAYFIAPELEAYVGKSVQVRFDPLELGRVYVFTTEQGFICIAECPERTGVSRQEIAAKAREMQKKRVQEGRKALKAVAKKEHVDTVYAEIMENRAEAAGKLMRFPAPSETHDSAGIQAAADAIAARDSAPVPHQEEDLLLGRSVIARLDEERQRQLDTEDPKDRYKRLLAKSKDRITLTEEERLQMVAFEDTPDYRSWVMFQEFVREQIQ